MIIYEAQTQYVKKEIQAIQLNDPDSTYKYLYEWFSQNVQDFTREHLILACLNTKNFVVSTKILTIGTNNQTLFQSKDILKHVLISGCASFVVSHSHPSGDPSPSSADSRCTRMLREASAVLDLNFIDHVILGEVQNDPMGTGYYSFRQAGML